MKEVVKLNNQEDILYYSIPVLSHKYLNRIEILGHTGKKPKKKPK
jgi:hypothetical protein